MYLFLTFLALIAPGADIRNYPSPCTYKWRVGCSMNAISSGLQEVYDHSVTNGLQATIDFAIQEGFDKNTGFFPWITRRPDSSVYGLQNIMNAGPLNWNLVSQMRARLDASLRSGSVDPCAEIELGDPASTYSVTACSRNLTTEYYVTYMAFANSMGTILCGGSTDSACNPWVGANLLGKIQYEMKSGTADEVKARFVGGTYDHQSFSSVLIDSSSSVWSSSNQSMPWFTAATIGDYGELTSFSIGSVSYKGWKAPLEMDGVQYQVAITHLDEAESVFPAADWASVDTSKSSCSPLTQASGCDSARISSYILGNLLQTSGLNTTTDAGLAQMFQADQFNFGSWTPQLRNVHDGSMNARGTLGSIADHSVTDEELYVVKEALATAGKSYVEFTTNQGPLRAYVVLIGSDLYAEVSFVNQELTTTNAPSTSQDSETTSNSATFFAIFSSFAFVLNW